jgi:hypothetical protein
VSTDRVLLSLLSRERSLDLACPRELCRRKLEDRGVRTIVATATPSMLADDDRRYFHGLADVRHVASNFVVRVQAPADVRNAVRRTTIQEIRPGWFGISPSKLSACVSIADAMVGHLRGEAAGRLVAAS